MTWVFHPGRGSRGYIDVKVCTQVLLPVVSFLGTHLTGVRLQVTRWRLYIPPPPLVVPPPLSFPRGGGGRHLVNPKFFIAAHCVVVWVTVLWGTATTQYPLHSWRDILLTFAKMELDSTTMFPPGTNVTDDDSDLNCDTEVVWVKSARGVWGMGHSSGNKLYFTRDIPEGKWVPKNLFAPAKPPTKKARPPPKSAAQGIPVESGEHVQDFKVKWSRTKKFYTELFKE